MNSYFKYLCLVCVLLLAASSNAQVSSYLPLSAEVPKRVTLNASSMLPLAAVLRLAVDNRVPLGIVLGPYPGLCTSPRAIDLKDEVVQEALADILSGTGYAVEGGAEFIS